MPDQKDPEVKIEGETRVWVVVLSGTLTTGQHGEKVFKEGDVINIAELGQATDFCFDSNAVRWASDAEAEKAILARKESAVPAAQATPARTDDLAQPVGKAKA